MAEINFNLKATLPVSLKTKKDIYDFAEKEFEKVGDDGLFPNHTNKDIWISGFTAGISWMIENLSFNATPLQK